MTPEEFAERMKELLKMRDEGNRHVAADELIVELLTSLGYSEGCDIFNSMLKYYE